MASVSNAQAEFGLNKEKNAVFIDSEFPDSHIFFLS